MFSLGRIHVVVLGLVAALLVPTAVAAKSDKDKSHRGHGPATIALPDGFQPEGIAAGKGRDLYVGSIPTGAIWKGDARKGTGSVLVPGREGRAAIGVKVDRRGKRIVAAGGPTGKAFVYGARDGRDIAQLQLAPAGRETFVNDLVLTRRGAYFTDSRIQQIYRVGARGRVRTIPLTGDIAYTTGNNANGIESVRGGRTLITVQGNVGKLFTIDPVTGATDEIDLGGATLVNGDGLLLKGRTLYVVQNRLNKIAVVRLARNLKSGRVVREITNPAFDVPTTLARSRGALYTVNARFGIPPSPENRYDIVKVVKRGR